MINVTNLNISDNHIQNIEVNDMIEYLDISRNEIRDLYPLQLIRYTLVNLNASHNLITDLYPLVMNNKVL